MLRADVAPRSKTGRTARPEYRVWEGMIARCHNPASVSYHLYGARGVTVCERWRNDFWAFVEDMGDRPRGCQLDRRDGRLGYEPGNCRWVTGKEQQRNKANNRLLELFGVSKPVSQWAEEHGIKVQTVFSRLNRGWPPERAATTKAKQKRQSVSSR